MLSNLVGMSGFLEQCRGQAVGAVGRKRKKNGMVLRDEAKIYDFCESFRYEVTREHFVWKLRMNFGMMQCEHLEFL